MKKITIKDGEWIETSTGWIWNNEVVYIDTDKLPVANLFQHAHIMQFDDSGKPVLQLHFQQSFVDIHATCEINHNQKEAVEECLLLFLGLSEMCS